jgi:hypothetical protein
MNARRSTGYWREVGLDICRVERVARLGEVGAAGHPGRRRGGVRAAVAAVVVDERVDVQPLAHHEAVGGEIVAQRVGVRDVAGQDERGCAGRLERRAGASQRGLAEVGADERQRVLVEVAPAQRAVAHERVDASQPARVAAAGVEHEPRLRGERLAVEDLGDRAVGVAEVAAVRGGAGADVQLALDVPLAAIAGSAAGAAERAGVQLGQAAEQRQVRADEPEVHDEVQRDDAVLRPGAVVGEPAERPQQARGELAGLAGRQLRPVGGLVEAAGRVEPQQGGRGERAVEVRDDVVVQPRVELAELPARRGVVDEVREPGQARAGPGLLPRVGRVVGERGEELAERDVAVVVGGDGAPGARPVDPRRLGRELGAAGDPARLRERAQAHAQMREAGVGEVGEQAIQRLGTRERRREQADRVHSAERRREDHAVLEQERQPPQGIPADAAICQTHGAYPAGSGPRAAHGRARRGASLRQGCPPA